MDQGGDATGFTFTAGDASQCLPERLQLDASGKLCYSPAGKGGVNGAANNMENLVAVQIPPATNAEPVAAAVTICGVNDPGLTAGEYFWQNAGVVLGHHGALQTTFALCGLVYGKNAPFGTMNLFHKVEVNDQFVAQRGTQLKTFAGEPIVGNSRSLCLALKLEFDEGSDQTTCAYEIFEEPSSSGACGLDCATLSIDTPIGSPIPVPESFAPTAAGLSASSKPNGKPTDFCFDCFCVGSPDECGAGVA